MGWLWLSCVICVSIAYRRLMRSWLTLRPVCWPALSWHAPEQGWSTARSADADAYFGKVLRNAKPSTRTGRAAALAVYFQFLELRHKVELHNLTRRVIECPLMR
jgi:hypothetical protein